MDVIGSELPARWAGGGAFFMIGPLSPGRTLEAEMFDKGIKVAVAVKKAVAALNAARCDQRVYRFADRDPQRAQPPKILSRRNCHTDACNLDDVERREKLTRPVEIAIAGEAL